MEPSFRSKALINYFVCHNFHDLTNRTNNLTNVQQANGYNGAVDKVICASEPFKFKKCFTTNKCSSEHLQW